MATLDHPDKWLSFRPSLQLTSRIEAWKAATTARMDLRSITTQMALSMLLSQALTAAGFPPREGVIEPAAELDNDASGDTRR